MERQGRWICGTYDIEDIFSKYHLDIIYDALLEDMLTSWRYCNIPIELQEEPDYKDVAPKSMQMEQIDKETIHLVAKSHRTSFHEMLI